MTIFENTIKTIIMGDSRARSFFETGIMAQRCANLALRTAKTEADMAEATNHNEHYREDMRYVARRVANITGWQHGLICDALVVIATEELRLRGPLDVRMA